MRGAVFLYVKPHPRSQLFSAPRPIRTSRSSARRAHHLIERDVLVSLNQAHDEAFMPIKARPPRRRLVGRRLHLTGFGPLYPADRVDGATPNRAAAPRANKPACDAFKTRTRRSPLNARPIQDLHVWRPSIRLASSRHITIDSLIGASALDEHFNTHVPCREWSARPVFLIHYRRASEATAIKAQADPKTADDRMCYPPAGCDRQRPTPARPSLRAPRRSAWHSACQPDRELCGPSFGPPTRDRHAQRSGS